MYVKKVIKHGNSLAVVIPADLCRDLLINRGDFVALAWDKDNGIVLRPITNETARSLKEKDVKIK